MNTIIFNRCISCGNYFSESAAADPAHYCSPECEEVFVRCTVCGEYYNPKDFIDTANFICSKECSKKYKLKRVSSKQHKIDFRNL